MINCSCLIVGAGPSGLSLAHLLKKYKVDFQIIEESETFSSFSKATGIHRNTLSLLEKIGLCSKVINASTQLNGNYIYEDGELKKAINFEQGIDPRDRNISISQIDLEKIFNHSLTEQKVKILFGQKLISFTENQEGIVVKTHTKNGIERIFKTDYLIGCDGAKSDVRKQLDFTFEGETTPEWSFTFDSSIHKGLEHDRMYMHTTNKERLVSVPIPGENKFKFSGRTTDSWHEEVSNMLRDNNLKLVTEKCKQIVRERSRIELNSSEVEGFVFYHTGSRLSSSMNAGRVSIIGDAAHIFFPAGGYGLNVAIEDAFALAWRLQGVVNRIFNASTLALFTKERLQNAQLFQQDANKKKVNSENPKAGELEREKQVYEQLPDKIISVRLESLIDKDSLFSIKNNTENLYDFINQTLHFACLICTQSSQTFAKVKEIISSSKIGPHMRFAHLCTNQDTWQQIDSFVANKNRVDQYAEKIFIIRPDNFVHLIPAASESLDPIALIS